MALYVEMRHQREKHLQLTVDIITEISSKLDNELSEGTLIGELIFGSVYKRTFGGNDVAIKKMKEVDVSVDGLDGGLRRSSRCWTSSGATRLSTSLVHVLSLGFLFEK